MAEKKKILYMVEAMGGGVFTYIVDLANELVDTYDMYIAYAVRKQTPANYKDYFDKRMGCCTAAAAKLPRKRSFRMAKNCLGVTAIRLNAGAGRLQGKSKRKKNVQGCIAFINEEFYNGLTLDDERIRQAIIEFRPRLVVIDPIQAYLGSDSDLQIAGRARKLMRRLGMWAAGYDCAIVLIGHLNKKEGSKGLYRSLGSIDVVAAARSVLQVERDTENPDIRIVHQIKNSLAPTAEDIRFSISADKGFRWLECRPQFFEKQQPDAEPKFDTEQQKAAYWIKHFLEKGDMSANEIYCRLDNEGVSKRVARMVKTEMGIHCYQKKRKWYWSVQPEEGAMNGSQV